MSLEQWVYYVVTRIDVVPFALRDVIEAFFYLPSGPSERPILDMSPPASYHRDNPHPPIVTLASLQAGINTSPLSPPAPPGDGDDGASEVTIGSLDDNGYPKKKKKRIMKSAKRRLTKALSVGQRKDSFHTEAVHYLESCSPTSTILSGTTTAYSLSEATMSPCDRVLGEVQSVQPGKLIKVR